MFLHNGSSYIFCAYFWSTITHIVYKYIGSLDIENEQNILQQRIGLFNILVDFLLCLKFAYLLACPFRTYLYKLGCYGNLRESHCIFFCIRRRTQLVSRQGRKSEKITTLGCLCIRMVTDFP